MNPAKTDSAAFRNRSDGRIPLKFPWESLTRFVAPRKNARARAAAESAKSGSLPGLPAGFNLEKTELLFQLTRDAEKKDEAHFKNPLNEPGYEIAVRNAKAHYRREAGSQYLIIAGTDALSHPGAAGQDWRMNFQAEQVDTDAKQGGGETGKFPSGIGKVHKGFLQYWDLLRPSLIGDGTPKHPGILDKRIPLYISGHSLGGAAALIASLDLTKLGYKVAYTITQGSPAPGDAEFQKQYKQTVKSPTFRFINGQDQVPNALNSSPDYRNVGTPIYMNDGKITNGQKPLPAINPYLMGSEAYTTGTVARDLLKYHPFSGYDASFRKMDANLRHRPSPEASAQSPQSGGVVSEFFHHHLLDIRLKNLLTFVASPLKKDPSKPDATERAAQKSARKFETGGPVFGSSHSSGGILAELEGGENVWSRKDVEASGGQPAVQQLKRLRSEGLHAAAQIAAPEFASDGKPVVQFLKRLHGNLGSPEPSGPYFAPAISPRHFARAAAAHSASSHNTHHHHDVKVRMDVPRGVPDDQRRVIEETARKAARDVLRRSIEHVSQSNPRLEGVA